MGLSTDLPSNVRFEAIVSDCLARRHAFRFRARGSSMGRTVRDHDVVTVASCDAMQIECGMIAMVRLGARYLVHRVVHIERGWVTTRGDASEHTEMVRTSDIIGRVICIEPAARSVGVLAHVSRKAGQLALQAWSSVVRATIY